MKDKIERRKIKGRIYALVVLGMFAVLMLAQPLGSVTVNPTTIFMDDDEWIGHPVDTQGKIYFDNTNTPNEIELMNARVGIQDQTPEALLDFDFETISTTAATEYGSYFTTWDTGIVTTGTDTTYGTYNAITRTGATGGIINTYGEYIDLSTDNAALGTHTAIGLYVNLDGNADNNYAAIFMGGNVGIGTATPSTTLHVNGDVAFGAGSTLTISSGAVTATHSYHQIDTGGGNADLNTINGGSVAGEILIIRAANSGRTVTAKDTTGNLQLSGDFDMNNAEDTLTLIFDGSNWFELSRSDNGA